MSMHTFVLVLVSIFVIALLCACQSIVASVLLLVHAISLSSVYQFGLVSSFLNVCLNQLQSKPYLISWRCFHHVCGLSRRSLQVRSESYSYPSEKPDRNLISQRNQSQAAEQKHAENRQNAQKLLVSSLDWVWPRPNTDVMCGTARVKASVDQVQYLLVQRVSNERRCAGCFKCKALQTVIQILNWFLWSENIQWIDWS